ncbi:MAG TPA: carboxypeptidase regulatory-like domain-containing protein, partial [Candidatus Methanoperedens sp.]
TDNLSGSGIQGAKVTANTGVYAVTDAAGFYSLRLATGTYTLTAAKDLEYYPNSTQATVTSPGTVTRDIVMEKKPTGTITGTVTN